MPRKPTARKPTDTVQVNLRIKESERRRLEQAAKKSGVSLNGEMAARPERTLEQEWFLTIDQLGENVKRALYPLLEGAHELNKQGDLIRATEALIKHIQPLLAARIIAGPTGEVLRQMIEKVQLAISTIENDAAMRLRRMHTTGAANEGQPRPPLLKPRGRRAFLKRTTIINGQGNPGTKVREDLLRVAAWRPGDGRGAQQR